MKIKCIKILKYNLYPKDKPLENFEFISKVLNQNIDPPSKHPESLTVDDNIILCSSLNRAQQCIKTSSDVSYMSELAEIPIDLSTLCTFTQWSDNGSTIIRKKFKEAFIEDELAISRKQILEEANTIFNKCKNYKSTTIVSHTFRLILLKAICETNGKIIYKPKLIHEYIDDNKHILDFGESFYIKKPL